MLRGILNNISRGCFVTDLPITVRARRLWLRAQRMNEWAEKFAAKVASGEWERECAAEARRPAFGPRVEEKSQ